MARKGKAVVCRDWNKPVTIEEIQVDSPRANQVLIQLEAIGVCHSDLSVSNGTMPIPPPIVLGHEACGRIVELGEGVTEYQVGDKVIPCWIPSCGHCRFCAEGRAVLCDDWAKSFFGPKDGTRPLKDAAGNLLAAMSGVGVMAEYAILHEDNVIKIDPEVPSDKAALVGCAVMTGVGAVLNTARVRPGETVVVVGCGGVGLNAIQGAAIANAGVIVAVDVVPAKLELARRLGATHGIDASAGAVAEAVHDLLGGGADHVFEAIGRKETIELAVQLVGRGGQAVLVGLPPPDAAVQIDTLTMIFEERSIRTSWYGSCRPLVDFPLLLDLYRDGRLRLDLLVSTCTLDEVNDAFAAMEAGEVARKVIVF